jgi:hypothetical protein
MSSHEHVTEEEGKNLDFTKSWVNSSKFIFYLSVICVLGGLFGNSYRLYQCRYKGHPDVEIQSSTKYIPEYK